MNRLRESAQRIARSGAGVEVPSDRLLALERVAARLANRRMASSALDAVSDQALRRRLVQPGEAALAAVRDRASRSCDRAAIVAYLLHYPIDHPRFAALRETAALAAGRHDWAWRERGERFRLWDGPATLAGLMSASADRDALLRAAGLGGRLATGAFVRAVLVQATPAPPVTP